MTTNIVSKISSIKEDIRIINTALKIFRKKDSWTTGVYARDDNGKEVSIENEKACQFCLMGAIHKAKPDVYTNIFSVIGNKLYTRYSNESISAFNDTKGRTKREIITLLKEVKEELLQEKKNAEREFKCDS